MCSKIADEADRWPLEIQITVAWGDMDALGHVNNTRFLRWFEDARIEAFRRIGSVDLGSRSDSGPILARLECVFRRPVVHPDTITSMIRASDIGDDRYTLEHQLVSADQQQVVAFGSSRMVQVDYRSGEKVPLPAGIIEELQKLR